VENLRVTKYNDNTIIDQITSNATWQGLSSGAWCWYNNDSGNNIPYGKLYNYYAVTTAKLCPTGWTIPTDAKWTIMTDYLGGSDIAGGKMKEAGLTHWNSPNPRATNESGFTGLPSGYRGGSSSGAGMFGYWWSSTEYNSDNAWIRYQDYLLGEVFRFEANKPNGMSVRCLRD
jgi:uncharacterized protein (TIGR02145 family)